MKAGSRKSTSLPGLARKSKCLKCPRVALQSCGENLLELARIALLLGGQQLRTKFRITDYKIYRVYPWEVQYLHPADGLQRKLTQAVRN